MTEEASEEPAISVKFVYSMCNDIDAMRHFYTDLLGLKEIAFYNDAEQKFGYLSYLCAGDLEFDFFYIGQEVSVHEEWSWQPGYDGGTLPVTSWSVQIPEADFPAVVKRLQEDGVKSFKGNPYWCLDSYWAFPVADPQGYTVEVYCIPASKPASTQWSVE
ncbi:VOC family protein [candidate division WOR-3 bacterium]|nr:VOC family protein [candidate division WOR-3 bacterium]